MADIKRNSLNAKVAVPKSSSTSPAPKDILEALLKAIGSRVKITTTVPLSETLEGSLFTADPILNVIAIDTRLPSSTPATNGTAHVGDYHLIPISGISSFQVTNPANVELTSATQPMAPVNWKRAKERVEARVNALKEHAESRGKGVTKEAQAIFDAMKRVNIPLRWHDKQMIAYEAVIIAPPYRPEDCKGSKDKQQVLNQVKKVLEGERRKLKEREEREDKADATQRKGG